MKKVKVIKNGSYCGNEYYIGQVLELIRETDNCYICENGVVLIKEKPLTDDVTEGILIKEEENFYII